MRERLSVTIITLNEEKNITQCLESVKWADEIVVVDSGSKDKTIEICRRYTDRVFLNPWRGMNEQKAFAMEMAFHQWILNIDADERVTDELRDHILRILEKPEHDGYRFPRKNFFLGRWMRYGGWYPDHVLRLFRKDLSYYGGINPHDKVIVRTGNVGTIKTPLLHFTYSSISQYIIRQNSYSSAAAVELFNRGKRTNPLHIFFKTVWKFIEVYFIKKGFLDGGRGLITALGSSFSQFMKYSKLWELERNKP